jgi:hypothetical protein
MMANCIFTENHQRQKIIAYVVEQRASTPLLPLVTFSQKPVFLVIFFEEDM